MRIDLHMHSTFSDGLLTPAELIDIAAKKQLALISLSDHDCVDGVDEAMKAGAEKGIEVVAGVELSSEFKGRELHILGYGVDHHDADLQEMLEKFRETRYKRGIKIVEKLNALGVDIEPAEVLAKTQGGALGRPHVAAVLVDKGVVSRIGEAFDKYIAEGGPAYVPKYKLSPAEAIQHIRAARGVAFVAHPGLFLDNMGELNELLSLGFDGIEAFHPSHSSEVSAQFQKVAGERGLLVSGGSDFHGFDGKHQMMGLLDIPYEVWENIKTAIEERH